ncbi:hypothetical protein [Pseudofulvibacter geojedonensis]|uniref:Uncharacterized protein n=1 Tax=Pseudofulvibacter geojedonensis TaxID=1123758 RepID=A0ABW3HZU1_9FLAO
MKKILGVLFYILGFFLSIVVVFGTLPGFFKRLNFRDIPYTIGQLVGLALFVIPIFLLFKYAKKWTKKEPNVNTLEIDDIGKSN